MITLREQLIANGTLVPLERRHERALTLRMDQTGRAAAARHIAEGTALDGSFMEMAIPLDQAPEYVVERWEEMERRMAWRAAS